MAQADNAHSKHCHSLLSTNSFLRKIRPGSAGRCAHYRPERTRINYFFCHPSACSRTQSREVRRAEPSAASAVVPFPGVVWRGRSPFMFNRARRHARRARGDFSEGELARREKNRFPADFTAGGCRRQTPVKSVLSPSDRSLRSKVRSKPRQRRLTPATRQRADRA